ncbi:MAG: hypothetical protein OEM50_05170 [Gammaproteobacteria bacterium]|nr:hypothetical protein [Gammaproteobacteria bacterium]MDH3481086.1 hypothetical protein [Gammaproteobacteria bacterium]
MSEKNPIRVFATHVFHESDDYLRIFEFLEGVDRFYYVNVSQPENIPASGGPQAIKDELIDQIKQSEAVFVLPGLYEQEQHLVEFMMDVADANAKNMIAVRPFGGVANVPEAIASRCKEVIEWNDRELADSLRRQARGEDTARWEVLDFPGFDANGPIE